LDRKTFRRTEAVPGENRTGLLVSKAESSIETAPVVVTLMDGLPVSARSPRSKTSTNFSVRGPVVVPAILWPFPFSRMRPPAEPINS
jgi:hypothetical protein